MIAVFTKLPIKPEFHDEYLKHLKSVIEKFDIRKEKGCTEVKILSPKSLPHVGDNNNFVVITGWEDMDSFVSFTKSESFKKSHSDIPSKDWFLSKPEVEVYETIEV